MRGPFWSFDIAAGIVDNCEHVTGHKLMDQRFEEAGKRLLLAKRVGEYELSSSPVNSPRRYRRPCWCIDRRPHHPQLWRRAVREHGFDLGDGRHIRCLCRGGSGCYRCGAVWWRAVAHEFAENNPCRHFVGVDCQHGNGSVLCSWKRPWQRRAPAGSVHRTAGFRHRSDDSGCVAPRLTRQVRSVSGSRGLH
jgi:hypothetical protein